LVDIARGNFVAFARKSLLFLKKKKQKDSFLVGGSRTQLGRERREARAKVFCFFFFRKRRILA
jgi:hypothetical protein